jgi:methyl-accepting chemotaxis protein
MNNTAAIRRKKQFVHRGLQSALVCRAMWHWLLSLVAITSSTLILWLLYGNSAVGIGGVTAAVLTVWKPFAFVLLAAVAVLPIIVIDLLKTTNRVAGPLVKLNNQLKRLSQGDDIAPIKFRDHDYCPELAESFNAVLVRIQKLQSELAELKEQLPATASSIDSDA